jgi:hypothetical protein
MAALDSTSVAELSAELADRGIGFVALLRLHLTLSNIGHHEILLPVFLLDLREPWDSLG